MAMGRQYLAEAIVSAQSLKEVNPELSVTLFTDAANVNCAFFDEVRVVPKASYSPKDKISAVLQSPYEQTLYLDTDTLVCRSVDELFLLLDRFDLALAHAPGRVIGETNAPASFPELNCGVILYSSTKDVLALFQEWLRIFDEWSAPGAPRKGPAAHRDQPAFREALFHSRTSFYVLPPEYNLRTCFPFFVGLNMTPCIIHDRLFKRRYLQSLKRSDQLMVGLPSIRFVDFNHFMLMFPFGRLVLGAVTPLVRAFCWSSFFASIIAGRLAAAFGKSLRPKTP